jgi:multiple sugar transport system ATP-binding protein
MAAITLAHVGKKFETTEVIKDVSLQIADGEFCVLVGPSGSGKSTLLRLIAGLETATVGTVHIGGRDVTHRAPKDRDIAMVFQSYALYPQMTVRENMGFGLKLLKTPKQDITRRVDEAARMLSLEALMDRRPAALSGGQRQRVAMGRAMVRQPSAFLFDEPLSNLDAALRATVRSEIRTMHLRSKTTSVYVTHDQVEAMTMGDRIVVLRAGQVEQVGTPVELYEQPINRFVAGFIGSPSMNLCELAVQREAGQSFALLGSSRLVLPAAVVASLGTRERVVLGVRPEHLHLNLKDSNQGQTPQAAQATTVQAQVHEIEFMGAQSQISLQTAAGPLVVCAAEHPALRVGDTTQVGLPTGRLHFFDTQTGLRLAARH